MARVKEFDREQAMQAAILTFAARGFEGTSTDDLLKAMGIGRQSMYDTFGDKRRLYLEALRTYNADSVASILRRLEDAPSPFSGIEAVLLDFAHDPRRLGTSSCLGVSSICEFGRSDVEVAAINDQFAKQLEKAFVRTVRSAIDAGEIDRALDARETARFLGATLCGMKVCAEGGSSQTHLVGIARMALRSLARVAR